jgi:hypothetical protein
VFAPVPEKLPPPPPHLTPRSVRNSPQDEDEDAGEDAGEDADAVMVALNGATGRPNSSSAYSSIVG